jgi:diaphanous 1
VIHTSSFKVYALVCELLAAICVVSPADGHKAVLSAFSDFRVAYDESFRFETLLSSLHLQDPDRENGSTTGFADDEEGIWDARIAAMALVNAITNCPDNLEDRMVLREEFSRRGLNELIVVCHFCQI